MLTRHAAIIDFVLSFCCAFAVLLLSSLWSDAPAGSIREHHAESGEAKLVRPLCGNPLRQQRSKALQEQSLPRRGAYPFGDCAHCMMTCIALVVVQINAAAGLIQE